MPPLARRGLALLRQPAAPALVLMLVLLFVDSGREPDVLGWSGLGSIANEAGAVALAAVGLTFVVLIGGFDLSAGAVISVVNVLVARQVGDAFGGDLGVVVFAVLVGCAIGLANGLIVTLLRIPSIVATLAMSFFWGGVALLILKQPGGEVSVQITDWFTGVAFAQVPSVLVIFVIVAAIWTLIRHTRFGFALFAIGGNVRSAAANGVHVRATTLAAYAAAGLCYGLAGVFLSAQSGAGDPGIGAPLLLSVFAAVVIGGTVFGGGVGGAIGSIFGALVLTLIAHVLYSFGVSSFYTDVFNGSVLLAAVILSSFSENGLGRELVAALQGLRRNAIPAPDSERSAT